MNDMALSIKITGDASSATAAMRGVANATETAMQQMARAIGRSGTATAGAVEDAHRTVVAGFRVELEAAKGNAEERVAIARRIAAEEIRAHGAASSDAIAAQKLIIQAERQAEEEKEQIRLVRKDAERDAALSSVEIRRDALDTDLALGRINAGERLELLRQLIAEESRIEQEALRARLENLNLDAVERARIYAEIAAVQRREQLQLIQATNQAAVTSANRWKQMGSQMSSAITSGLRGMVEGTGNALTLLRNIVWNGVGRIIDAGVQKMIQAWVEGEAQKTAATAAGEQARNALQVAGAAEGKAAQATSGIATIFTDAKTGAAGAYSALAGIPIVGPVLGAAAAATVFAAIMAFGSGISSAAGGWDNVPEDQMAMVHKREMILPASLADLIRSAFSAGPSLALAGAEGGSWGIPTERLLPRSAAPAQAAGGGGSPYATAAGVVASNGGDHFHFHCIDGPSVQRMVKEHGRALAQVYKQGKRDGFLKDKK